MVSKCFIEEDHFFSLSNGGTVRKNLGEQDIQIASFINKFGRRLSTI